MYSKCFTAADTRSQPSSRPEKAGTSQDCPLSPFLFVMVMTVLMANAHAAPSAAARASYDRGNLEYILIADDPLLISNSCEHIQEYMAVVERPGLVYGLHVHNGKVHLVRTGSEGEIQALNSEAIQPPDSMIYVGTTIHSNDKLGCECAWKTGGARAECEALSAL